MKLPLRFPFGRCFLLGLVLAGPAGLSALTDHMPAEDAAIVAELLPDARVLEGGVRLVVQRRGEGPLIARGDRVTALYTGRLLDGTIFNQKRSASHSFRFTVGAEPRQVILGWERSLPRMQEGGLYTVAIPAELAYREHGRRGQVPPNATIIFELEILRVERAGS